MTNKLFSITARAAGVLNWLSAYVAIPAIVGLVTLDVVRRYFLNAPLIWANEVTGYLLLLVFLFAIPHCSARAGHIRIDLLYPRLPGWAKRAVDLLTDLTGLALGVAIAWQSVRNMEEHLMFGDAGPVSDFPYWPLDVALILCGGLLGLTYLAALIAGRAPAEREPE